MALLLDGVNDVATIATLNNLDVSAITLAAWVWIDTAPPSSQVEVIVQFDDGSNTGPQLGVFNSGGSVYLDFVYGWSTTSGRWRGDTVLETGRWYHVVATYDRGSTSNDARLYVNGVEEDVTEITAPTGTVRSGQDRGTIGSARSASAYIDGRIQDVVAWDTALSPRSAEALYLRGPDEVVTANQQAWWEFASQPIDRIAASDAALTAGATIDSTLGYPAARSATAPANWQHMAETETGRRPVVQLYLEGMHDVLCNRLPADPKTQSASIDFGTTGYAATASVPNVFAYGDATIIAAVKWDAGQSVVAAHTSGSEGFGMMIGIGGGLAYLLGNSPSSGFATLTSGAWSLVGISIGGDVGLEVRAIAVTLDSDLKIVGEESNSESVQAGGSFSGVERSKWDFSAPIEIGRAALGGGTTYANNMLIGYVAMYSRAYSVSEMRRLLGRVIGSHWPQADDLIAQWTLEEGSGTILRSTTDTLPMTLSIGDGSWEADPPWSLAYREVLGLPSSVSQQLQPRATRSTIGGCSCIVLDTDEWLTEWLADVGYNLRNRSALLFWGWDGLHEDESVPLLVGSIGSITPLVGAGYEVAMADATSLAKRSTLVLGETTLLGSISDSDTIIPVRSAAGFEAITYAQNSGSTPPTVYIKIDDEIIECVDYNTATASPTSAVAAFTTSTGRGALGTSAAAHADGAAITELLVDREAHPLDMALRLLLSGHGNNADRSGFDTLVRYGPDGVPDETEGRGAGLTPVDIDLQGFANVKRRRYAANFDGSLVIDDTVDDLKELIERELLRPLGAYLYVTAEGRLSVGSWHGEDVDASTPAIESGDMQRPRALMEFSNIVNSLRIRYSRDAAAGDSSEIVQYEDADSGAAHGRTDPVVVDSSWIRSNDFGGTSFAPQKVIGETMKQVLFGRFADPLYTVNAATSFAQWAKSIGDVVALQHPHLPDFDAGVRGLMGKGMQIIGRTVDLRRGRMIANMISVAAVAVTLTEDEDLIATFVGTDLGSSYSTGALEFTPKAVLVFAADETNLSVGFATGTSTTAGVGQARLRVDGTGVNEDVTSVLSLTSPSDWRVTAFSSAGVTIARYNGSDDTTMFIVVVLG